MQSQPHFGLNNPQEIIDDFMPFNGTVDMDLVRKLTKGLTYASESSRPIFARNLNALYAKASQSRTKTNRPFLPLPQIKGNDITLGILFQGENKFGEYVTDIDYLVHTASIGMTGAGKSTLSWQVMKQIVAKNCHALIFDRKRDMRNILNTVPVCVLGANDLRIKIFKSPCPEINQRVWISKVCDLFTIFGLYWSSRNFIKEKVIDILEKTNQVPTIFDVYNSIKSKPERSQTRVNYHDASLNKIENLVEELGPCFSCRDSFPLEDLLRVPLAIEVDQLSMQSERFLIAYFLLALIEIRKAKSIRGNPGIDDESIFIFIDEAANLWNPQMDKSERTQEMSFDILQEIPLIARDYKICLFFSSQRPLSRNIMANARTKFLSNLPDSEDAWHMANAVGVKPEIFQKLGRGEFLVKTGNLDAFLIRTEKIERQIIDDKRLEELKRPFVEHILTNCTPLEKTVDDEKTIDRTRLNDYAKNLLINVALFPSMTVTQRYDGLSLKGKFAQELKQSLIDRGMVEEVFLAIGSSKMSTFLVPTQKAIDYLESNGTSARYYKHVGKTSAMHQLVQAILMEQFENRGLTIEHDSRIGEKFADVIVQEPLGEKRKVVFEIAVNPSIDLERVKSSLDKVDQFVVVATDIMVLNNMDINLQKIGSKKILVMLATNLLAALRKDIPAIIQLNSIEQQNKKNIQNSASDNVEQEKNRRDTQD